MSDPTSTAHKLIRKARRIEEKLKGTSLDPEKRAALMSNVNKLEQEIASLIFNPHAVSQAEVESKRCEQLLKRRSTTSANRPYRENSAKIARQNAVSAIQHATRVEENARQIIDSLMGREAKQTTQEKVE